MSGVFDKSLNINGKWIFIKDMFEKLNIEDIKNALDSNEISGKMGIPSKWELAGLHNYNGIVWLIKEFEFNFSSENLNVLKFQGIDYFTEVWFSWNYLGKHEGCFSLFIFDISSSLNKPK